MRSHPAPSPVVHGPVARTTPEGARLPLLGMAVGMLVVGLLAAQPAWALYREVGPDGRITYTDRPADPRAKPLRARLAESSQSLDMSKLPYELRQVAERYPVALYVSKTCSPCATARDALRSRGIPYQEWSVDTRDDIEAFKQKEGSDQLPVLRIGGQRLKGYQSQEWSSYLDLAGYPGTSKLPADFVWPAPQPLAPRQPPQATPAAPVNDVPTPMPAEGTPPGFRF